MTEQLLAGSKFHHASQIHDRNTSAHEADYSQIMGNEQIAQTALILHVPEQVQHLSLNGSGVFCIESECPKEELIEIELQNDVLKVDGNYAIAWSKSLDFTVERSGKSLIGSAASGEGLVNVYRGTGKVLMMPTAKMPNI